jgi:hypothetical protein
MYYVLGEVGFVFLSSHRVTSIMFLGEMDSIFNLHITFMCIMFLGKVVFVFALHIMSMYVVFIGFSIGNHLHFGFKHKTFNYSFNLCSLHIVFVPLCLLYHNPFQTVCKLKFTNIPCLTTKFQLFQSLNITFVSSLEFQRFGLYTFWNSFASSKNSFFNFDFATIFFFCHLFISIFLKNICEDNLLFTTFHAFIVY